MLGVSPDLTSPNHNPNTNNNNNNHTPLRPPDGGAMVAPPAEAQESGGTSGGSCGDGGGVTHAGLFLNEEGEKTGGGGGGSRWPRQETLALLKIRSDMDLAFRDSSLKGPLWEEVSRKMAELGYHRNAKKCKEKFENVYKYHKRTKEGRSSKADGKTYRFFDQLQALDNIIGGSPPPQRPPPSFFQSPPPPHTTPAPVTMAVPIQAVQPTHQLTVSSTPQNNTLSFNNPLTSSFPQPEAPTSAAAPPSFFSNSPSSSSSTSSDEDVERRHKRKRKYKELFESLMKTVVEKQEDFQRKFLETLDQREKSRMLREEAWRAQEIARLKNEHQLLSQERSNAAARESTLISLLQKITQNHQNPNFPNTIIVQQQQTTPTPSPAVMKQSAPPALPLPPPPQVLEPPSTTPRASTPQPIRQDNNNGGLEAFNTSSASSSRWPKAEIDALINLRTYLDNKYQENGPKGPLWEEISSEMKKIGYNRNAKRCKEKWENINKYFKKVKESNKKRPQDSKTCPYFHQLEALYKEKEKYGKPENSNSNMPIIDASPEQQWPLLAQERLQEGGGQVQNNQVQQAMEERATGENNNNNNDDDDDEEYDDDGEDDDEEEEDEGSGYEIVTNKQPSSVTTTA